jgi:hypothetical protein
MDDFEFKEVAYYGISKEMKKNSESLMEHTHASQLIVGKIEEYMIDTEKEQREFIVTHDKM